eukprot:CAMPEP_0117583748 /NCGR_PEP_ID=MMETSP0784-20121206/67200_1 /TAXON_ID=39447 /ORGANISM="" /LENGTH=32 /DNA_ID= /DNA_START= /DNA_END= /DNA_ORIENTATION=
MTAAPSGDHRERPSLAAQGSQGAINAKGTPEI